MKNQELKKFEKVVVVGVGLIGGSVCLACKKNRRMIKAVVGVTKTKERAKKIQEFGIVDFATHNLQEACKGADLVVLAVPLNQIQGYVLSLKLYLDDDAIVTDVASVKGRFADLWTATFGARFVPGHPMAGSEKLGYTNARADLFVGKPCILTPSQRGFESMTVKATSAVQRVEQFWKALGAKVLKMPPMEHDRIVGAVSHVPHALIFAYLHQMKKMKRRPDFSKYAGPGFWDTTRIGASDKSQWAEIFMGNKENISQSLMDLSKELRALAKEIKAGDKIDIANYIEEASKFRKDLSS